jgi:hypothetical protein
MKITMNDIPAYGDYDNGERINLTRGAYAIIKVIPDEDMGPPWKEHDGHGPVSGWENRDKKPGELILNENRGSKRFYDFAEAVKIAKRDGWDTKPYGTGTKGERAHRAAMADYESLRGWCNDDWHWIGVVVTLCTPEGEFDASLWGIESEGDYWRDVAVDLIAECRHEYAAAQCKKRKETKERNYWAFRGVVTV